MFDWIREPAYVGWLIFGFDLAIRIWMSARVVRRRLPAGVAWAWLSLILFLPLVGTILYLTFGEYRQSRRRTQRLQKARGIIEMIAARHRQKAMPQGEHYAELARAFEALLGLPRQEGNDIDLLPGADHAFAQLANDIESARRSIDLEFYIWSDGGRADLFGESLLQAAKRGVRCRLLVDAVGSGRFIKGEMFRKLREGGVEIVVALPSGFWRSLIARPDLRIHRKIIVIDNRIAYAGSMNLADPKYFKMESGAGPWVDALARIQGPAVAPLAAVFLSDWCAETGQDFRTAIEATLTLDSASRRKAGIQCLPSGPAVKNSEIEQALLMAIAEARTEIVITTPYFLPSESLLYALTAAARRGIKVALIVPEKVDSTLTHYASRSFFEDLLTCGVQVYLFKAGLLHTKSVIVDGKFSLFGSLNLDPRSLRINFEITLAIFDEQFSTELGKLHNLYIEKSYIYTLNEFNQRQSREVWIGDLARLLGPLL